MNPHSFKVAFVFVHLLFLAAPHAEDSVAFMEKSEYQWWCDLTSRHLKGSSKIWSEEILMVRNKVMFEVSQGVSPSATII